MRLIFTENTTMMALVAAALAPVKIDGQTYTLADIQDNPEIVNNISANSIKTKTTGGTIMVSALPSFNSNIVEEPDGIASFDDVFIEKMGKYLTANHISDVLFALSPTASSVMFIDLFMKAFHENGQYSLAFHFVRTDIISADFIKAAVNEPGSKIILNGFQQKAHMQQSLTGLLKAIVGKESPVYKHVSPSLLLALDMIRNRSGDKDGTRVMARSKIPMALKNNPGGIAQPTNMDIDCVDAVPYDDMQSIRDYTFRFIDEYSAKFPTMEIIYGKTLHDSQESLAKDLFYRGYITNPDTLSYSMFPSMELSPQFIKTLNQELSRTLSEYNGEDSTNLYQRLSKYSNGFSDRYAPLPLLPLKRDLSQLSEEELALYNKIRHAVIDGISGKRKRYWIFASGYNMFTHSIPENKQSATRPVPCVPYSERLQTVYDEYGPDEEISPHNVRTLLKEMVSLFLLDIRSFSGLINTLIKYRLVSEKDGILTITDKGVAICECLADIRDPLLKCVHATNLSDGEYAAYSDSYKKIRNKVDPKDLKAPKKEPAQIIEKTPSLPEVKKEAGILLPCPSCKEESMSKLDGEYECSSCGFMLPQFVPVGGVEFELLEQDIKFLAKKGRVPLKKASLGEDDGVAGFITFDGESLSFTNQTSNVCPVCGSTLFAYHWGYGCNECDFFLTFDLYGVELPAKDFMALLKGGQTSLIKNLDDGNGNIFSARFRLTEDGQLKAFV